jgi:hypothetical protein
MLHFFRTIRKKLIESISIPKPVSPAGRYLLYAIGEILLVVIGILIALQVNNWNEDSKSRDMLHQYLTTISSDLQSDQVVLDSLITRRKLTQAYSSKARMSFLNKTFDFTTVANGLHAYVDYYFVSKSSGFEALKNSGYLGRINGTSLNQLLIAYQAKVAEIAQAEKSYNEFVENLEVEMAAETDRSLIMAYLFVEPEELRATATTEDEIVRAYEELFASSGYRNIISQAANMGNLVDLYVDLKSIGLQTIDSIEEFIDD